MSVGVTRKVAMTRQLRPTKELFDLQGRADSASFDQVSKTRFVYCTAVTLWLVSMF